MVLHELDIMHKNIYYISQNLYIIINCVRLKPVLIRLYEHDRGGIVISNIFLGIKKDLNKQVMCTHCAAENGDVIKMLFELAM